MQNTTFYALATNKDGKTVRVPIESTQHHLAVQEAEAVSKEYELKLTDVRPIQGVSKQGGVQYKFAKYRKQNKGQNPKSFDKAL